MAPTSSDKNTTTPGFLSLAARGIDFLIHPATNERLKAKTTAIS